MTHTNVKTKSVFEKQAEQSAVKALLSMLSSNSLVQKQRALNSGMVFKY